MWQERAMGAVAAFNLAREKHCLELTMQTGAKETALRALCYAEHHIQKQVPVDMFCVLEHPRS